jgi:hypothetical protein
VLQLLRGGGFFKIHFQILYNPSLCLVDGEKHPISMKYPFNMPSKMPAVMVMPQTYTAKEV